MIFTSFNQYLVFETETTLIENLKTLSSTRILYHVYTPDCPLRLLGSVQFHSEWSAAGQSVGQRTILALMSEVDPLRQRRELSSQKRETRENDFEVLEDDEGGAGGESEDSDDDGDIFA